MVGALRRRSISIYVFEHAAAGAACGRAANVFKLAYFAVDLKISLLMFIYN